LIICCDIPFLTSSSLIILSDNAQEGLQVSGSDFCRFTNGGGKSDFLGEDPYTQVDGLEEVIEFYSLIAFVM
jgi:hypothetical protein